MVQAVPKLRYRLVGARISPLSLSLEEAMLYDYICFLPLLFAYLQNTPYLCTNKKNTQTIYLL